MLYTFEFNYTAALPTRLFITISVQAERKEMGVKRRYSPL